METADIARVNWLIESLATDVTHMGTSGTGHAAKALNNLLNATSLLSACEVLAGARKMGLDEKQFIAAVNAGSGRSYATEVKIPRHVLTQRYDSGFSTRLMAKDVAIAANLLDHTGSPTPVSRAVHNQWQEVLSILGNQDHTLVAELLGLDGSGEPRTNHEVNSGEDAQ